MALLHTLHFVNCSACFVLGTTFNGILICLVLRKTEKEMRSYRHVLLQTCAVDVYCLLMALIVQPVFVMLEGSNVMVQNGPLRWLPQPWNFLLSEAWLFGYHFAVVSMLVQFIYRYRVVCRDRSVSVAQHWAMLGVGAAILAGFMLSVYWSMYPNGGDSLPGVKQSLQAMFGTDGQLRVISPGNPNGTVNGSESIEVIVISMIGRPDTFRCFFNCTYGFVIEVSGYAIITYCGLKIRAHIRTQSKCLSDELQARRLKISQQITKTLIIQAILPVLASSLSVLCIAVCWPAKLFHVYVDMPFVALLTVVVPWIPTANPLVTLFTVRSYRRHLVALVRCKTVANKVVIVKPSAAMRTTFV